MDPELIARLDTAFNPESFGRTDSHDLYNWLLRIAVMGLNMMPASAEDSGESLVFSMVRTELLRRRAVQPYVLFDIGASIGEVSEAFKQTFGDTAIIHAFEPSNWAFNYLLRKSVELNWQGVIVNNLAMGAEAGEAILYARSKGNQAGSLYHRQTEQLPDAAAFCEAVKVMSVDDYCREAGITHIDFLKIDVEGHETAVLQGCRSMIEAGSIDFIQFEFGGTQIDSRTYFRDFWNLLNGHYEINRILRDGLSTITKYEEILEIFEWQNFLAVRRI